MQSPNQGAGDIGARGVAGRIWRDLVPAILNYGIIILFQIGFDMQAEAGQLIAERYLLLRELGGDAAFSRWLAQDTGIGGVLVEIAFLPPEIAPGGRAYADLKAAVSLS